jgi:hypothetical protein
MKSPTYLRKSLPTFLALIALLYPFGLMSQITGNGNIVKSERQLSPFNKIEVGSAFTVSLSQGEFEVIIETDENLLDQIETTVKNDILYIGTDQLKNPNALKVYISAPQLSGIEVTGAARLESVGLLLYPKFNLNASGAARVNMELETGELNSDVSGAARVKLTGSANTHKSIVSGAASINALRLRTISTNTTVSGASRISVFATNEIISDISGAGAVNYFDDPEIKRIRRPGSSVISLDNPIDAVPNDASQESSDDMGYRIFEHGDSVMVELGKIKVHVNDNDETSVVIGRHNLEIDDHGNVKFRKDKRESFDGHWGGFDLGINGLLNPDRSFDMPEGYEFLDQKMEKSINIAINAYEQSFNLIGDHVGLLTGLGLEWNNYRFRDNTIIEDLNDELSGFMALEDEVDYVKSKLVTTYLTLPLMIEIQTNSYSKSNSFHIGAGILSGLRIGTHTKLVHENGKREIEKNHGASSMNPFKIDLMGRLGWGKLNLYGKYALNSLFKKDRGIELYPFSVGLSLVNW